MVFSSLAFLFYFLPLVVILYFAGRSIRWRNFVLMLMSLVFYLWGAGEIVVVLMLSIVLNWIFGLLAERAFLGKSVHAKRLCLTAAVALNIGLLGYYKYATFIVAQINQLLSWLWPAFHTFPIPGIVLPIGISFFTFQGLSYVIDVARGRTAALRNPMDFAMYLAMFPQLIAGPIVRYHEIAGQIRERSHSWAGVSAGVVRFIHGLVKKTVFADTLSLIADQAFGLQTGLTRSFAWTGILAFTLQAYFDFSGYSDMAIGLGRVFGFEFPENFNRPYSAVSFTDFWRRWHMTLSAWFRDYVYIPLGGSRTAVWKQYRNLFAVFLLVGLWHGANWTFVVFGVYHGLFMSLERLTGRRFAQDFRHPALQRYVTFFFIMMGMVIFRSQNIAQALAYYQALFSWTPVPAPFPWLANLSVQSLVVLAAACLIVFWPLHESVGRLLDRSDSKAMGLLRLSLATAGLTAAVMMVVSHNFIPFIYFKF